MITLSQTVLDHSKFRTQFEKELGFAPKLHGPTLDNVLSGWENLFTILASKYEFPSPDASVKTVDETILEAVKVRVYSPPGYLGNKPLGLYIHGGGWVLGDLETEDAQCRQISKGMGVVIVSVDYRLAPAHKYPTALEDCLEAFQWALKNAASMRADANQAFIIGGSAGGGLALGTALKLIDMGHRDSIKGVVAIVPITCHPDACPEEMKSRYTAYEENKENTVNTTSSMMTFFGETAL
jgi:versiconal hemiacetal acetate esterase